MVRQQVLEVAFRRGAVYQYTGIPKSVHQALMSAPSHGKFFYKNIRTSFPYKKI